MSREFVNSDLLSRAASIACGGALPRSAPPRRKEPSSVADLLDSLDSLALASATPASSSTAGVPLQTMDHAYFEELDDEVMLDDHTLVDARGGAARAKARMPAYEESRPATLVGGGEPQRSRADYFVSVAPARPQGTEILSHRTETLAHRPETLAHRTEPLAHRTEPPPHRTEAPPHRTETPPHRKPAGPEEAAIGCTEPEASCAHAEATAEDRPARRRRRKKKPEEVADVDSGGEGARGSSGSTGRKPPPPPPVVEDMQMEMDPDDEAHVSEAEISLRLPGTNKVLSLQLGGTFASALSYVSESASLLSESMSSLLGGVGRIGMASDSLVRQSQSPREELPPDGALTEDEREKIRRDEISREQAARFRQMQEQEAREQQKLAAALRAAELEREVARREAEDVRMGPIVIPSPFLGGGKAEGSAVAPLHADVSAQVRSMRQAVRKMTSDAAPPSEGRKGGSGGAVVKEESEGDTRRGGGEESEALDLSGDDGSCGEENEKSLSTPSAFSTLERNLLDAAVGAALALRPIFTTAPPRAAADVKVSSQKGRPALDPPERGPIYPPIAEGLVLSAGLDRLAGWLDDMEPDVVEVPEVDGNCAESIVYPEGESGGVYESRSEALSNETCEARVTAGGAPPAEEANTSAEEVLEDRAPAREDAQAGEAGDAQLDVAPASEREMSEYGESDSKPSLDIARVPPSPMSARTLLLAARAMSTEREEVAGSGVLSHQAAEMRAVDQEMGAAAPSEQTNRAGALAEGSAGDSFKKISTSPCEDATIPAPPISETHAEGRCAAEETSDCVGLSAAPASDAQSGSSGRGMSTTEEALHVMESSVESHLVEQTEELPQEYNDAAVADAEPYVSPMPLTQSAFEGVEASEVSERATLDIEVSPVTDDAREAEGLHADAEIEGTALHVMECSVESHLVEPTEELPQEYNDAAVADAEPYVSPMPPTQSAFEGGEASEASERATLDIEVSPVTDDAREVEGLHADAEIGGTASFDDRWAPAEPLANPLTSPEQASLNHRASYATHNIDGAYAEAEMGETESFDDLWSPAPQMPNSCASGGGATLHEATQRHETLAPIGTREAETLFAEPDMGDVDSFDDLWVPAQQLAGSSAYGELALTEGGSGEVDPGFAVGPGRDDAIAARGSPSDAESAHQGACENPWVPLQPTCEMLAFGDWPSDEEFAGTLAHTSSSRTSAVNDAARGAAPQKSADALWVPLQHPSDSSAFDISAPEEEI